MIPHPNPMICCFHPSARAPGGLASIFCESRDFPTDDITKTLRLKETKPNPSSAWDISVWKWLKRFEREASRSRWLNPALISCSGSHWRYVPTGPGGPSRAMSAAKRHGSRVLPARPYSIYSRKCCRVFPWPMDRPHYLKKRPKGVTPVT
jgi:hypothetical protein